MGLLWIILSTLLWLGVRCDEAAYLYSAPCNEIKFKNGDIVTFSSVWSKTSVDAEPRHWLFALTDMHLWHIAKDFYFFPQKGFVDIMKPEDRMSSKRTCVVRRRVEGRPYTGNAGKLLAMRMRYMPVVFNFLTCSCRHYMDYIVYGRSYGDYRTWHYLPASNDCPVHRHFDRETDVTSANFKLARKDARGNLRSVEWPTGWTQERMEEVLSGSRLCPLAPTIEAAIAQVKNVWERNLSQIKKKGLFSCFLTPRKNNVKGEPEITLP